MFGKQKSVREMSVDDASTGGGAVVYAGFWRRVFALLIDWVVLTAATIVIAIPLIMLMDGVGATIAYVIGLLVQIFYWPVMESSARQATFGKVLMGIKVTDTGGQRTGFGKAFLRNLAKVLSSLIMGIGFLMAAFTSRKQALHDMVVSCLVVREGPSYFLKAVIVMVIALVVVGGGGGYYLFSVLLPQQMGMVQETMMQHDKVSKEMPKSAPSSKPAVKAQEKPAAMTEKPAVKAQEKPAVAQLPEKSPPPPVPAKPAVVEVKPAPPVMTVKPAPVAAPVVAEKPAAPRRAAPRKPAAPAAPAAVAVEPVTAAAAPMSPAPKYNDVMTAVMNRDIAGATEALDFGIWVDREATGGLTPLMVAADYGDAAMVQLLLKYGANPNRSGSRGSVLDHARRSGNARTIELLQKAGAR